jgi:hypothetical protein
MNLYRSASSDLDRVSIKQALFTAAEMPVQSNFSGELLARILNDSANVVDFLREFATSDSYEITQETEDKLLWLHRRNIGVRNDKKADASVHTAADRLDESISAFRMVADANTGFTTYKILVGYNSVFPPMWDDENFDIAEAAAYRNERIDELVTQVNETNADEWLAILQRCAQTKSDDLATFPSFGEFLQKLGRSKPTIVIRFLDKLGDRLTGFLGIMLSGLAESGLPSIVNEKIQAWLKEDRFLPQIAHYCRLAPELDPAILKQVLDAGIRLGDDDVVAHILAAARLLSYERDRVLRSARRRQRSSRRNRPYRSKRHCT